MIKGAIADLGLKDEVPKDQAGKPALGIPPALVLRSVAEAIAVAVGIGVLFCSAHALGSVATIRLTGPSSYLMLCSVALPLRLQRPDGAELNPPLANRAFLMHDIRRVANKEQKEKTATSMLLFAAPRGTVVCYPRPARRGARQCMQEMHTRM